MIRKWRQCHLKLHFYQNLALILLPHSNHLMTKVGLFCIPSHLFPPLLSTECCWHAREKQESQRNWKSWLGILICLFSGHNLLVAHTSSHSKKAMRTNFNNIYGPQPKADHLALEFFRLVVFSNFIKENNFSLTFPACF